MLGKRSTVIAMGRRQEKKRNNKEKKITKARKTNKDSTKEKKYINFKLDFQVIR